MRITLPVFTSVFDYTTRPQLSGDKLDVRRWAAPSGYKVQRASRVKVHSWVAGISNNHGEAFLHSGRGSWPGAQGS